MRHILCPGFEGQGLFPSFLLSLYWIMRLASGCLEYLHGAQDGRRA